MNILTEKMVAIAEVQREMASFALIPLLDIEQVAEEVIKTMPLANRYVLRARIREAVFKQFCEGTFCC
jgi:hypothetical protein